MKFSWKFISIQNLFPLIAITASVIFIVLYLFIALPRISFPFTLEWVEGNSYLHVVRVLEGKPLYVAPSYDFIPMIYTPFYFYFVALFAKLTGNIMLSLRLVSIFASIVAMGSIYGLSRARKLSRPISVMAIGFFAAAYGITGFWFDIGRVDMLFVALLLVAILMVISPSTTRTSTYVIAAGILCLSFATKQQAIIAYPFLLLYLLLERRIKALIVFGGSFLLMIAGYILISIIQTDGWFWYYTYTVPSSAPIMPNMIIDFWTLYIIPSYFPSLIAIILMLVIISKRRKFNSGIQLFLLVTPLLIMSLVSMAKQWGYINGLLPVAAGLAIASSEAFQYILSINQKSAWLSSVIIGSGLVLLVGQFVTLRYDPENQIPSIDNQSAGTRIVDIIRQESPPIFSSSAPYLIYLAGHQTHYHSSSLGDIYLAADHNPTAKAIYEKYVDEILMQINQTQTAILDAGNSYDSIFNRENGYICISLVDNQLNLTNLTGAPNHLDRLCRRN